VCVVLASGGYPGSYEKGKEIHGLETAETLDDVVIFHAGTKKEDERVVTAGGRVLGVTALAGSMREAKDKVYKAIDHISFDDMHYRKDIGHRALI
jgi:phosphoribosylamine--glycine ligase